MEIEKDFSLKQYNTFGIAANAAYFSEISNLEQLQETLGYAQKQKLPLMILGGGSNILFTGNYHGLILKNALKGIEAINSQNDVLVKVSAGENWHSFVMYCIENHYCGLENLSLIPGCVGASPMQNIGAYGVEQRDFFYALEAIEIKTGEKHTFYKDDCAFGYRESIFKHELKDKYVIVSVTFKLNKKASLNISYGAIIQELEKMQVQQPDIKDVSNAVINIRRSKLPDPKEIGNAGSFFKNPVVSNDLVDSIKQNYPDLVSYPIDEHSSKLAAGWLIEKAGWKGYKKGDAGVHRLQALVLVNYGDATGQEIFDLSREILQDVFNKFGVQLEREVNIIGS